MNKQLAGGFNKANSLTFEEFDALNTHSFGILGKSSPRLLESTRCTHVALEQMKTYISDQQKKANFLEKELLHIVKAKKTERAKEEQDPQYSSFLVDQLNQLKEVSLSLDKENRDLAQAHQKASEVANHCQELAASLQKSQRTFATEVQNYVVNELNKARISLDDNRSLTMQLSPQLMKDLVCYLRDNSAIDAMMERPEIKQMLQYRARVLEK